MRTTINQSETSSLQAITGHVHLRDWQDDVSFSGCQEQTKGHKTLKDDRSEFYRSALNSIHDLVLVKGPNAELLWANQAFLDYYGMTQEDLSQIIDAKHSDPDDTLQYVKDDLTVFQSGKSLNILQESVTNAAGDIRYFHTIKSPVFENGKVVRTVGVSRLIEDADITTRAIGHEDAKQHVAPIKAMAGSFPNPMLMVDVHARVLNSSPLWKSYFGAPMGNAEGVFCDVYPDLPDLADHLERCLKLQSSVEDTVTHVAKDGTQQVFSARTCPWHYQDGSVGGATIIATDITILHEKSAELSRVNEELKQFAYRASHDLKGPLSTAKGLAKFIAMDVADGDLDGAIVNARLIEDVMGKLEKSVMSFLALATADANNTEATVVDVQGLIADICRGLAHDIDAANVIIETDLERKSVLIQHVRLRQILENLLANGVKYSDPDKERRFVKVCCRNIDDERFELTVEDNGCGIPSAVKHKIFDLFSRFHEKSQGTGLGLAIVKKHVEDLGGEIAVESTKTGTLFRAILPASPEELDS